MECLEKSDIRADQFDKFDLPRENEDLAGKYTARLRKTASKAFVKKV